MIQQVDKPTHGTEILDLILTNDHDLVSSVSVEPWPRFTDHEIVTAHVSYHLGSGKDIAGYDSHSHLIESGKRLKAPSF